MSLIFCAWSVSSAIAHSLSLEGTTASRSAYLIWQTFFFVFKRISFLRQLQRDLHCLPGLNGFTL